MSISDDLFIDYQIDKLRVTRTPFGVDQNGERVTDISRGVVAALETMKQILREQVIASLSPETSAAQREAAVEAALNKGMDHLVRMLNTSVGDSRYLVTREFLEDSRNFYSFEFNLLVNLYAKAISRDERFDFIRGVKSIPASMDWLTRPLTIAQRYETLPRLVARFVKSEVTPIEVQSNRAVIQWRAAPEAARLPEEYIPLYVKMGAEAWKGLLCALPYMGKEPYAVARVLPDDDPLAARWEFTWPAEPNPLGYARPWFGLAASVALLMWALAGLPLANLITFLVPVPFVAGYFSAQLKRAHVSESRWREQLLEQQRESDQQHIELVGTYRDLQGANADLERRVQELTALQEAGEVLASTLDMDTLLNQMLDLVREKLGYDRAMVLLIDEETRTLTHGRFSGGTEAMQQRASEISVSLEDEENLPSLQAIHSGKPVLMQKDDAPERTRLLAETFGTDEFLMVPLQAKGIPRGVLVVDNSLTNRPLSLKGGDVLMALGRSVSVALDNARLYQAVEESLIMLEERVEERSQQLQETNEELRRQREEAERANRLKSQFLANMSHELRTPLNSIIGYTELVLTGMYGVVTESQADRLQRVLRNGRNLLLLINDVLDLSKIEADKMDLLFEPLNVNAMVEAAAANIFPLAEEKGVTIKTFLPDHLPEISADHTRFLQIINNLLSNAVKFTREGTVTVSGSHQPDRKTVILSITDTGIGIPDDQIDQVFDEFRQVDGSTTREFGGTGLGLAITRRLARLHGGDVTVESMVGEGSTFTVIMPITQKASEAALPAGLDAPAEDKPLILVIDDQPEAVEIIQSHLTGAGYRSAASHNGQDGIRMAKELHPDAITLDISMPGMDGWAVLSELRSDPGTAAIPVIVVSIIDQRPMAIELGAFEYVTKPIHPERLLGLLGRALIGPPTHPILIVDDNPDDRDLISTILSSAGYNVALAAGGSEAVQWLGQHPARLVMLDLMMPKVSGFDVLKSIRETHPTLPVVVVTAKSLTREDQEILDKGLAEVISKEELAREDLLDQIRKTLTRAAV